MTYKIEFRSKAVKFIDSQPDFQRKRIYSAINKLPTRRYKATNKSQRLV